MGKGFYGRSLTTSMLQKRLEESFNDVKPLKRIESNVVHAKGARNVWGVGWNNLALFVIIYPLDDTGENFGRAAWIQNLDQAFEF